jgi:aldehyde:ferredoxin oxidoreductase
LADEVTKAGEQLTYPPKAFIVTGLLYALELRQPIQQLHEVSLLTIEWVQWANRVPQANVSSAVFRAIAKRFWGSELAGDFSTYEGKALAAKMIQDRQMAKESLILCDSIWPVLYVEHSPDHVGDPSLESKILSAIAGRELTEEDLYRIGERIVNLQRAVLAREGHLGRESDTLPEACFTVPLEKERLNPECLLPGKDGEVISRKGAVFDRQKFHGMLGEFYEFRGWDRETGLQTKARLEDLELHDVARDLAARGLLS